MVVAEQLVPLTQAETGVQHHRLSLIASSLKLAPLFLQVLGLPALVGSRKLLLLVAHLVQVDENFLLLVLFWIGCEERLPGSAFIDRLFLTGFFLDFTFDGHSSLHLFQDWSFILASSIMRLMSQ